MKRLNLWLANDRHAISRVLRWTICWLRVPFGVNDTFKDLEDNDRDSLTARLRHDAPAWSAKFESSTYARDSRVIVSHDSPPAALPYEPRNNTARNAMLALAAAIALMFVINEFPRTAPNPVAKQTELDDVSRDAAAELAILATIGRDSLDNIEASVAEFSPISPEPLAITDGNLVRHAIAKPIHSFSRGYSRTIAFIAKHSAKH